MATKYSRLVEYYKSLNGLANVMYSATVQRTGGPPRICITQGIRLLSVIEKMFGKILIERVMLSTEGEFYKEPSISGRYMRFFRSVIFGKAIM